MNAINWPTGADFLKSLQNPSLAFRDDGLKEAVMETNRHGMMMMSGRFATVFKANLPGNKEYALRVFTTHPGDKTSRYEEIAQHIKRNCLGTTANDSVFVDFNYFDRGIRNLMDGKWYPLVQMEWVRGKTMFAWLKDHCASNNKSKLNKATEDWIHLIKQLKGHDVAHGDLQHNNIMFNSADELKLVDYDGMCVPRLAGLDTLEYGVEPYQHPDRNSKTKLTTSLDDFSSIFIYVGLYALAQNPSLWKSFVLDTDYEKLLFRKEDLESPNNSELFAELERTAPDAYELSKRLSDLYNGPIEKVPVLDDFLFSWDPVYTALQKRNYREVDNLVQKAGSQKVPADLIQPIDNAQKRLAALEEVSAALQSKDERLITAAHRPQLLSNWPEADAVAGEINAAMKIPPIHQKLMPVANSGKWTQFSSQYDSHSKEIQGYPAGILAGELAKQQLVIDKCNQLLANLDTETKKPEPNFETLKQLDAELTRNGPHPEMPAELSRLVSAQIERGTRWADWSSLAALAINEETDQQLLSLWREDLFGQWSIAEAKRGQLDSAANRLDRLADLRSNKPPANGDLKSQEMFVELGDQLPVSYKHSMLPVLETTRIRIDSFHSIQHELKQDPINEVKLAKSWEQIVQHAGQHLVDSSDARRCSLANSRSPLIQALAKLPSPKSSRAQFDQGLVRVWDRSLLDECEQVTQYKIAFKQATTRLAFIKQLQAAVTADDEFGFVQLAADPTISKYDENDLDFLIESTPEFSAIRRQAEERHAQIHAIKSSVESGEPEKFLELYNENLINQYSDYFLSIEKQLHEFISEHVVGSVRLKKPPIGDPIIYMGGNIVVRWRWPDSREAEFLQSCSVGVCAGNRAVPNTPDSANFLAIQTIERDQYERGQGLNIPFLPNWDKAKLAVWGVISIGGKNYYTNRLLLGAIDIGKGK